MTRYALRMAFAILLVAGATSANATTPPVCLDAGMSIELVAAEPAIVTPVSCRFDSKGRLFVVESHTHFPPDDYAGPKADLIKIFDDPDGDGKLDRVRVFFEGTVKTMSLAIAQDDSVYVATRNTILRLRDTNGDSVADTQETIVTLDTKADYPHNGLSGLLIDEPMQGDAVLTFGMGENFGEPYVLRGSDGTQQVGGGEGGNIFRCTLSGGALQRVATGFWNPFGLCRTDDGRLLMVDNDADAMPPCRIVDVKQGADYGFQFRFGRAGTHPLQAWNGELPGTWPMMAGTGEAPCAIINHRGQLWVTSWGDNRIEGFMPVVHDNKLTATMKVSIQGGAMFRPVDMAIAPDGSMYVTDWVDRSYNVHRKGRIWRVRFPDSAAPTQSAPNLFQAESVDPVRQSMPPELASLVNLRWQLLSTADREAGISESKAAIAQGLTSTKSDVRFYATRWAAELGDKSFAPAIAEQLETATSPRMVAAIAATLSFLETGKVERGGFDALTRQRLIAIAMDRSKNESLRQMALTLVPPDSPQWNASELEAVVKEGSGQLAHEALKHLVVASSSSPAARDVVTRLAKLNELPEAWRLDLQAALPVAATGDALQRNVSEPRPQATDLDQWMKLVGEGGDATKGWRVFFGQTSLAARCAACHAVDGRGAGVGPDLTNLAGMNRRRLLESILHPSREIGPMYATWKVLTSDGRVISGLKLNGGGVGQSARYLLADASTVDVPMEQIEQQELSDQSVMPNGIAEALSVDQLRDLLAYLADESP